MECVNAVIHAIEAAKIRAEWYSQEKNPRYLEECLEWLTVAKIYSETELQRSNIVSFDEPSFVDAA